MKHNIYNITVTPTADGLTLEIVSNNGTTLSFSGDFHQIYPIVDTILLGTYDGEEMEEEYLQ